MKSFAAAGSVYDTPMVQNCPWAIDATMSGLLEVTVKVCGVGGASGCEQWLGIALRAKGR